MIRPRTFALLAATLSIAVVGCADSNVFSPVPEVERVEPGTTSPAPAFPTVAGTVYDRVSPSSFGSSRYVLNTDGTFRLQYLSPKWGFGEYAGRYTRTGSAVVFDWDGWSVAGRWGADGVISGDSLSVTYNINMMLSDFEDGVYVRSSAP